MNPKRLQRAIRKLPDRRNPNLKPLVYIGKPRLAPCNDADLTSPLEISTVQLPPECQEVIDENFHELLL